ncbi:MAG: aldo/keto reductase [Deltaproteobacteria bacterium]|nr:aldo/keto reductase [Deltaproteobacteria bacterium]
MRYKLFGNTGLRVSELCLGAMTFGEEWGWGSSKEDSRKVYDRFVEAGGNFIDTANLYTNGTSERYVGEFIASDRGHIVLATKYTLTLRPEDPNAGGNHRKNLVQSLDASLNRLNTDYIDLLWVHAWDFMTPSDEVMRALDDAVRAGKVIYIGVSDAPAWIVSRANTLAELKGWTSFAGLQIQYSLIERTPERDLLPMAKAMDIAITPWGALGGGMLSGKYKSGKGKPHGARYDVAAEWGSVFLTERNFRIADVVSEVAAETGRSASQVSLAWLRQQSWGVIVPIIGARTVAQVYDNMGCLDLVLTDAQLSRLDEASRIELGFPHDFLVGARKYVFGDTYPLIDAHRTRS